MQGEGTDQENGGVELAPETQALAERGRQGTTVSDVDPVHLPTGKTRPDDVPEKFWDAEKGEVNQGALLKSYAELEKLRGAAPPVEEKLPVEEKGVDDKGGEQQQQKQEDDKAAEGAPSPLAEVFSSARDAYSANNGDLPQEQREALIKVGIPAETIDLYLAGVKAQEKALAASVYAVAGGEEAYRAAVQWAAANWDEKQIKAYDKAMVDPSLTNTTVRGLMAEYREANPGEGRLTTVVGGSDRGEVYASREEYLADMSKAENAGDNVARQAAVRKLERSLHAGTVKSITPRNGPFRN